MIADNWRKNMKKSKEKKEKLSGLSVFDHYECDGQMSIEEYLELRDRRTDENKTTENPSRIPV